MGVGAFNEVIEFAATHLLRATEVGGYQNTGRDLIANMLGGAAAGVVAARRTTGLRDGEDLRTVVGDGDGVLDVDGE